VNRRRHGKALSTAMNSAQRFVLLAVLVSTILMEVYCLLTPVNTMAAACRHTERMKALREWATARTPETQAAWDRERHLVDVHFDRIHAGVIAAIFAEGILAVIVIRKRASREQTTA
jgi:hypothetical protein